MIFVVGSLHIYFNILSPTFVKKTHLEKPFIPENIDEYKIFKEGEEIITDEHIEFLTNEIGAYKLHSDPITKEPPEMEFRITDTNQIFTIKIVDGKPKSTPGEADNPDIKIYGKQIIILEILSSDDLNSKIVEKAESQEIGLNVLADEKTLALKGYKAIYDAFTKNNQITGNVVEKIKPGPYHTWTKTILLLYALIFIEIAFVKKL